MSFGMYCVSPPITVQRPTADKYREDAMWLNKQAAILSRGQVDAMLAASPPRGTRSGIALSSGCR
jgi:hypothetical protein